MLVVHEISGISAILCKYLQGHSTLLCNQQHTLNRLVLDMNSKVGIVGSFSEVQSGVISKATHQLSDSADYAVSFVDVRYFMENLGLFVKYRLAAMYNGNCDTLLPLSAAAILILVDGISAVFAERNEDNGPILTLLPVFYPISFSAFCPATSLSICSATGSVLITPPASRRLRILDASTRPCVTCTATDLM